MATKNRNGTPAPRRRASQRLSVQLDLAETALKALMVEQCRSEQGGWLTVYRAARGELLAAGVPEAAFPAGDGESTFEVQTINVCSTGSAELLKGSMRAEGVAFELEIDWGGVRPYCQGAHPAVTELARTLLGQVLDFVDGPNRNRFDLRPSTDLSAPFEMLAAHPRATDYKPGSGAPRLIVTPAFLKALKAQAGALYQFVHSNCEVHVEPAAPPAEPLPRRALQLVAQGQQSEVRHG